MDVALAQALSSPFLGGMSLSLVAGPLGAFLVWHRLAYVADAFAHAAILGMVIAAGLHISQGLSIFVFALLSGGIIWACLSAFQSIEDTLLVLFSGGAMSLGLFVMGFFEMPRAQIIGYLAGDIWAIGQVEAAFIVFLCVCVMGFLLMRGRMLLSAMVCPDSAHTEGTPVRWVYGVFLGTVFLFVLLGLKWAGSLFMTIGLVCPIVIVSPWVRTPMAALCYAAFFSGLCFTFGFYVARAFQTPLGPTMGLVMVGAVLVSGGVRMTFVWYQRRLREHDA